MLVFQLTLSWFLLSRSGNIPVGFDDTYSYLYGIKKVVVYGTAFPHVLNLNMVTHFNYLSYNLIFGWLSRLSEINADLVFFSSFYWGKIVLLGSYIYWLKQRGLKNGLLGLSLLTVGLFVGDGSIHGSFWVVPSFWMLIGFLLIDGYVSGSGKVGMGWLVLAIAVFYNIHPLSIVLLPYLTLYQLFIWLNSRKLEKKILVVLAIMVGVILVMTAGKCGLDNCLIFRNIAQQETLISVQEEVKPLEIGDVQINLIPLTLTEHTGVVARQIIDGISITVARGAMKLLNVIARYVPGVPGIWRGYVGKYLVFYPLLWMLPIWIKSAYNAGYKRWIFGYLSVLLIALGMTWHSQAYRLLLFVWPYTCVVMIIGSYFSLKNIGKMGIFMQFVVVSGAMVLVMFVIFQAYAGVRFVRYIGSQNQYRWDSTVCPEMLLGKTVPKDFDIFYNSFSGISAFTYHGLDQRHVGRTDRLLQVYPEWLRRYGKLYLVTENAGFDGGSDSVFTENIFDKLNAKHSRTSINLIKDCGFFDIWEISD